MCGVFDSTEREHHRLRNLQGVRGNDGTEAYMKAAFFPLKFNAVLILTLSQTHSGTQTEDIKAQSELLYLNRLSSTQDFIETAYNNNKLPLYLSALYTSVCVM